MNEFVIHADDTALAYDRNSALLAQVPPLILLAESLPAALLARASFAACVCRCSLIRLAASGTSRQQNEDPMRLRQQPFLWAGY